MCTLDGRLRRKRRPKTTAILVLGGLILLAQTCHASAYMLRYERIENDVLITGHGTAACFEPGKLLTAAHNCLNNDTPIDRIFIMVGKDWKPVQVVQMDKDNDIALIRCDDAKQSTPLGTDPRPKDQFMLIGSKRGTPLKPFKGTVIRAWDKGFARFLADVEFDHGDSGCPIVMDGKIAGIAVAGLPLDGDIDKTKCLFVPATVLRSFLAN